MRTRGELPAPRGGVPARLDPAGKDVALRDAARTELARLEGAGGANGRGAQDDGWAGRGFIRLGLLCVLVLGGGFGTWAATAKLSGAVIAQGQLRVETNKQVVEHPDGGVVGEILVRDGDVVEAGDVLLRLDDTLLRSELAALESQLYEIMARRGRLEAAQADEETLDFDPELLQVAASDPEVAKLTEGQRALFHAKRESTAKELAVLGEKIVQTREQITGAEAELAAQLRQSELIAEELEDQQSLLAKGLAQASRVLALEREASRLGGQAGQLRAEIAKLKGEISEIEIERVRLTTTDREEAIEELRELGFRELELKQKRLALREKLSRLDLRAPRAGVVLDLSVHALHSVVRAAEPVLYIVPNDTELVVDARISPINIDQIYRGQDAILRFSAFNSRTTPEIFGSVMTVAPDIVTDEQTKEVYYKAELALKDGELAKLNGQELMAGMPVEIYIRTGARTPLNYMMKPITDYFNRAMRED
jgi:HlyD family secretion protein